MSDPCHPYSGCFKAKVALAAIREEAPISVLALKYGVHETLIHRLKQQALAAIEALFSVEQQQKPESSGFVDRNLQYHDEVIKINDILTLSPPLSVYAEALYTIIVKNKRYLSRYMTWPNCVNAINDTAEYLNACMLAHQKNESKTYIVVLKGEAVGILSFNAIDHPNKIAYLGYWLSPDHQGRGIIHQSINSLIEKYTDNGDIHRFVIKCSVHNARSNAVAKRCGFRLEGTLYQAELIDHTFHDQNIYAWINSENA